MSYPRDLDEYAEHELSDEVRRRKAQRAKGLCDYCGQAPDAPVCKVGWQRHQHAETVAAWKAKGGGADDVEAVREAEFETRMEREYPYEYNTVPPDAASEDPYANHPDPPGGFDPSTPDGWDNSTGKE